MSEPLPIAVDTLGGDYAPEQVVEGAVQSGVRVILAGPEPVLGPLLQRMGSPPAVSIERAEQVIRMDEHPHQAVRAKKDSSMMVAVGLVKEGRAASVMSAGNTGAFVVAATTLLGRLPAVRRPAAATPIPTPSGHSLLLDAGAAADCSAEDLVNFAVMGDTYARLIWGIPRPRIGLLSIGEEASKGNKQVRHVHKLLKQSDLNFIGNVQGSDVGSTAVDVIVCDGFTGNVALKVGEGIATLVMEVVKDELVAARGMQRLAALVLRPVLRKIKKRLDWQEYGGGALLGVSGNVVIAHGKSKKRAIASAVLLAAELARTDLLRELEKALKDHHSLVEAAGKQQGLQETDGRKVSG